MYDVLENHPASPCNLCERREDCEAGKIRWKRCPRWQVWFYARWRAVKYQEGKHDTL